MADEMRDAARALFDAVRETVEQIAPSSGADPGPLAEEDATALILWTYQFLRDDLRAGVAAGPQATPDQDGGCSCATATQGTVSIRLPSDECPVHDDTWVSDARRQNLRVVAVPTGDQEHSDGD